MTHFLDLEDVRNLCFTYALERLAHDEPIPSFDSRFPNRLESALGMPATQVAGHYVHASREQQAAVLFYEMIKQHPFMNGNKRIACVSLMTFLSLNDTWLHTTWKNLYDIAVMVANSPSEHRDAVLHSLVVLLKETLIADTETQSL